jgi:outer membrane protein
MKKSILSIVLIALFSMPAVSQKYAYVDTEYILSKIPAYENAQTKLETISKDWQNEIEQLFKQVDQKYKEKMKSSIWKTKPIS